MWKTIQALNYSEEIMKYAFFDAKSYDKPSFDAYSEKNGIKFKYYEAKLDTDTADLAKGCDGVCIFVNDTANKEVIDRLHELGIKAIALRCAGFNNVDLRHAEGKLTVFRVPAYSPNVVAEHAMAMLLTLVRRTHKAYIRTRDFNFSLNGLTGFDLHGRCVGVIGTGRIGRVFIDICKGFGMRVLAYDKFPTADPRCEYVPIERLFAESDIISLHCPLNAETDHIINKNILKVYNKVGEFLKFLPDISETAMTYVYGIVSSVINFIFYVLAFILVIAAVAGSSFDATANLTNYTKQIHVGFFIYLIGIVMIIGGMIGSTMSKIFAERIDNTSTIDHSNPNFDNVESI